MRKKLFHTVALFTSLSVVPLLFGTPPAGADVATYYDGFYACDAGYYPDLVDCRGTPGYPDNPTESQCRYSSANQWSSCLSALYPASPEEEDYCVNARQAVSYCNAQYGIDGADPDPWAAFVCYNGTGIEHCE